MPDHRALCPRFHKAVELVGARWTGAIIQMLLAGRARFTELAEAVPDMSDRMLSERLRVLEAEGIVQRTVIPEVPVRIEYGLTEKGRALQSALDAIARWAERWVAPEDAVAMHGSQAPRGHRASSTQPRVRRRARSPRATRTGQ